MKNQLPELTPKPESWDKILRQAGFESQLGNHLDRLPQYSPNEETWGRITGELDRKKTVSIWIKWSVAASIIGFLFLAGLSLNRLEKEGEIKNQDRIASQSIDSRMENVFPDSTLIEPSQTFSIKEARIQNTLENTTKKKISQKNVEVIELPKINLPELKPTHFENICIIRPELQLRDPIQSKTLHQVSISWSKLKPGLQVTTPFGEKGLNLINQTQAATEPSRHITIEINN